MQGSSKNIELSNMKGPKCEGSGHPSGGEVGENNTFANGASSSRLEQELKWVIFPDNKWIKYWDMMMICLLYALIFIIPYQIGVSAGYYLVENLAWMIINVIIDSIFVVDTLLYFWRAYREIDGHLVFNLPKIRKRYLRTFFVLNMLGNIPTTLIFYFAYNDKASNEFSDSGAMAIKALDILKLFRLVRLSHIFSSSEAISEFTQNRSSQAKLTLIKYTFLLVVMSHCSACIWSFLALAQAGTFGQGLLDKDNWITYWHTANHEEGMINPVGWKQDLDRYILSLFWSIQTITSIGYGNILPFTPLEWWFGCVLMLLSGVLWAYIIGGLVGCAAAMAVQEEMHRNRTDQANEMMRHFVSSDHPEEDNEDELLPDTNIMVKRIRRFLHYQRMYSHNLTSVSKIDETYPVIESLSPELQRLSSFMLLRKDIESVPYLSSRFLSVEERSIVARGCMLLEFCPGETIHIGKGVSDMIGRGVFVFIRGSAFANHSISNTFSEKRKRTFIVTSGSTFNDDQVLLEDGTHGSYGLLQFIVFTRIIFIPRNVVLEALKRNPKAWKDCARWKYLKAALYTLKHRITDTGEFLPREKGDYSDLEEDSFKDAVDMFNQHE